MRCWRGYLSGVRCRLFAYGPADATASQNPITSCLIQIQTGFTFWYRLTQSVLEKGLLNGLFVQDNLKGVMIMNVNLYSA